jgi:tRNA A-37 threonylcarbamoyl transferase component Bud32/tetratricopeptide (TPR) repeat protein
VAGGPEQDELATTPERPSRPGPVFAPGDLVADRYYIVRFLAEGGMGEVYEARDTVLAERVALKTIRGELAKKPNALARFKREIHVARQVTHPNVCRVFDLGEHGATTFLTMQLLEGESLASYLKRCKRLDVAQAHSLARQIAAAIDCAHAAGVIHRDLKPANIILVPTSTGGELRAVVTDFGLARAGGNDDHQVSNTGDVVGTPAYMAPEQVEGANVGAAADIYAFGILLYEMVTGARPFTGESSISIAVKRIKENAPSPRLLVPDLGSAWDRAILRCLERAPEARYATAAEVVAALDDKPEVAAKSASTTPPAAGRRPVLRWLALGAGLVFAAAAGVYLSWPRGGLPGGERVLAFVAINRGSADDASLAPAVERIAARRLRARELRFRIVDDPASANVIAKVGYRRLDDGVEVDLGVGPANGTTKAVGTQRAPSVVGALDALLPSLADRVGEGRALRGPTADELAAMQRIGAPTFEAYRLYEGVIDASYSSIMVDDDNIIALSSKVVDAAPTWAHAYALLVSEQGVVTPAARATLARAREKVADRPADPGGKKLLDALELETRMELVGASALLAPEFARAPDDVLLGWHLTLSDDFAARTDEALSVSRRLHEERPDLQFGSDLAQELMRVGRGDEIADMIRAWVRRAPDNEQAVIAEITVELDAAGTESAVRRARDQLLLRGREPSRLIAICDVFIAADRLRDARALADEAMHGTAREQLRAKIRLGAIATMEGRFSAALESLSTAGRLDSNAGVTDDEALAVAMVRDLADALGLADEAARARAQLVEKMRLDTGPLYALPARYDVELGHGCTSVEGALANVEDEPTKRAVRRELLRVAAEHGCVPCSEVVRAGQSAAETSVRSLYNFGHCAEQQGELALAQDAYKRAERVLMPGVASGILVASPLDSILARYHHATILERSGQRAAAKKEYEDFLAHWGHADRPLPEIDDARKAVERLESGQH